MRIMTFVGRMVERHAVAILIIVLALSAFAVWSVTGISVVTTQDTFLSPKSQAFQGYRAYENAFGGDSMLILIPGSPLELATTQALQGFTELDAKLSASLRRYSTLFASLITRSLTSVTTTVTSCGRSRPAVKRSS